MDNNEKRKQDEELLARANAYFEKLGLSVNVQTFFADEHVRNFLHTAYAENEAKAENVVRQLPKSMKEKADKVRKNYFGHEEAFVADVLDSFKVNMANIFAGMEMFVPMDSLVGNLFATAFESESDGKMFEVVKGIADQMLTLLMAQYIRLACIPEDFPADDAMILALMADGNAVIPMSELLDNDEDWDYGDDDEADDYEEEPQKGTHHEHHCHCNGECGRRCSCAHTDKCEEEGCQCKS